MLEDLRGEIEKVLDERVRPYLMGHSGNLEVASVEDGVLYVRFLGQCHNCPSATITLESIVSEEVLPAFPQLMRVALITDVSRETWDMAYDILAKRRAQKEKEG